MFRIFICTIVLFLQSPLLAFSSSTNDLLQLKSQVSAEEAQAIEEEMKI